MVTRQKILRRFVCSDKQELKNILKKGIDSVQVIGLSPIAEIKQNDSNFKESFFDEDIKYIPKEKQELFNAGLTVEFHIVDIKTVVLSPKYEK